MANDALLEPALIVVSHSVEAGRITALNSSGENTYVGQIFINEGERVLISLATQGVVLVSISLNVFQVQRMTAIARSSITALRSEEGRSALKEIVINSKRARSLEDVKAAGLKVKTQISTKVETLSARTLFDGRLDGDLIHLLQLGSATGGWNTLIVHISIEGIFDDSWRRSLGSIMALIGFGDVKLVVSGQSVPRSEALTFSTRMARLYGKEVSFDIPIEGNLDQTAMLICSTPREYRPDLKYVVAPQFTEATVAVYGPCLVRDVTGGSVTIENPPKFQRHLAIASPIYAELAIFDVGRMAERFDGWRQFLGAPITDIYFEVSQLDKGAIELAKQPLALFEPHANVAFSRFSCLFDNDRYRELLSANEATVIHEISDQSAYKVVHRRSKSTPSVAVVIPMRDMADLTRNCIESLKNSCSYENYRIVVVDNGSVEEESIDLLRELENGGVEVIAYPFDFNFAAIANFAVDRITTDFVLLLNNDIEVRQGDFIADMVALSTLEGVGVVGQRLVYPDSDIQHCGIRLGFGEAQVEHFQKLDNQPEFGQYLVPTQFSAVTGAALMVAKSTYLEVGGMDAVHLKVSYNDIDLCLKIAESGRMIVNNPFCEVVHFESKSRGQDGLSLEKIKRNANERAYMVARWDDRFSQDLYWPNID